MFDYSYTMAHGEELQFATSLLKIIPNPLWHELHFPLALGSEVWRMNV